MIELLANSGMMAGLIIGAAILLAVILLVLFLRKGGGEANVDGLKAEVTSLRSELQQLGGRFSGITDTQTTALGDLTRTLNDRLNQGVGAIQGAVQTIGTKLDADVAAMEKSAVAGRERLQELVEQKLDASSTKHNDAAGALRAELTKSFADTTTAMTSTLRQLGADQQEKLNEFSTRIAELTKLQNEAQEKLRNSVEARLDQLRTENSAKLDEMRQTVDEKLQSTLEKRLGESFNTVSEQLKRVHEGLGEMQNLATGVGDLKRVLTNVKTRGTWAEVQLRFLLEDYLTADQFVANAQMKPNTGERVEFAVRFPGRDEEGTELYLPIDSKFPKEDYERLMVAAEAADPVAVEAASAALETAIRNSAKTICDKYINPPHTTDFAILFLPTEGLFAEVLRRPGFFDRLQRDYRVTVAGPTTLSSLLNAFQMGFRSLAIQQRSSDVWKVLGAVRTEFDKHGDVLDRIKRQLSAAANSVDALGTRTRSMRRHLKDVEALPAATSTALLGLAAPATGEDDSDLNEEAWAPDE